MIDGGNDYFRWGYGNEVSKDEIVTGTADFLLFQKTGKYINLDNPALCPSKELVFRALDKDYIESANVVILGQDPYHTPGKASGLAFGYHPDYKGAIDSSLSNIFTEIQNDLCVTPKDKTLESWQAQGVLLLNTRLTTLQGQPMAHAKYGWEKITAEILKHISAKGQCVFMLWGGEAKRFKRHISGSHNLILETSHPCRYSAQRGFLGCHHFSQANAYLINQDKKPIQWGE